MESVNKYREQWIMDNLKKNQRADKQILSFIADFAHVEKEESKLLSKKFKFGYCYYFANMLYNTFERGELRITSTKDHIFWKDDYGVSYDIDGVFVDTKDSQYIDTKKVPKEFKKLSYR